MSLDGNGYKRKTYDEILTEMQDRAKQLFGENANVSEKSFIGILLRVMSWFVSLLWQDNEDVYYSAYVKTATGNNLDRLLPYGGISRIPEQNAEGTLTITGMAGYTVPAGFKVSTTTDIIFETLNDVTLSTSGTGAVSIRAVNPGQTGNVAANTIIQTIQVDVNIVGVTNPVATSGGREKETDQEVRERFKISVDGLGKATLASIRTELLTVEGVRAATVVENVAMNTDGQGRPPKSIEAYVLGGSNTEIAQTILNTKAAGIETHGNTTVVVQDISGANNTIKFSRATQVNIYIKVSVKKDASFPIDGEQQLESILIRHIGGSDSTGAVYTGLNMGDDVIHAKLVALAYQIAGVYDVGVQLSTNGTVYNENNITIAVNEVAQTEAAKIEVSYIV